MEMRTSHEIHVVKSSVAHATMGEARKKNGRTSVRQNEVRSQYPSHGISCRAYDFLASMLERLVGLLACSLCSRFVFSSV